MKKIKRLPVPTGSYQIGRILMNFIDSSRIGAFPDRPNERRNIPIMIWYPSDTVPSVQPCLPLISENELKFYRSFGIYRLFPSYLSKIETNSFDGLPLSLKKEKFQVIFFNHGYEGYMCQNTIQMELLASHGYIVVSIGHPYEAGVVTYPDGAQIKFDTKNCIYNDKNTISQREFKKLLKRLNNENLSLEKIRDITYLLHPETITHERLNMWAADTVFIADKMNELQNGAIPSKFVGKFDLSSGFGVFGHSFGGATAAQVCFQDERFVCGINLDGGPYGELLRNNHHLSTPFMCLSTLQEGNSNKLIHLTNSKDSYLITIRGAGHYDFADISYALTSPLFKLFPIFGKINKPKMVNI